VDDARRFLRYAMPGMVFLLETVLWLYVLFPGWIISQLASPNLYQSGLAVAIGGLLATPVLGYFFGAVHHCWHWYLCLDSEVLNHVRVTNRLTGGRLDPKNLKDREKAWEISLALWYKRVENGGPIGEVADTKLKALGDMAHGLGTARVATCFSLVVAILYMLYGFWNQILVVQGYESWCRCAIVLGLAVPTVRLFHDAYKRVGMNTQGLYDRILKKVIKDERKKRKDDESKTGK
jgi:hypothetical protein